MKKTNGKKGRNAYAGIPANMRDKIIAIREIERIEGGKSTPQQIYASIIQHQKERAEKEEQEKGEREKRRQEQVSNDIKSAIDGFSSAYDIAVALERGMDTASYFDEMTLGQFARMAIAEAGEKLERVLCDLDLIPEGGGVWADNLRNRNKLDTKKAARRA